MVRKIKLIRKLLCIQMIVLFSCLLLQAVTVKELLDYRTIRTVKVSPDGTRAVIVVNETDIENNAINSDLWIINFLNGHTFQLTKSDRPDRSPVWSPDGKKIAFLSNRQGPSQIWTISPDGGEAEPSADLQGYNIRQFDWLPDGRGFMFLATGTPLSQRPSPGIRQARNRRVQGKPIIVDEKFTHYDLKRRVWTRLYQLKLGEKQPQKLFKKDDHITSFDISPDGTHVAFSAQPAPGRPQAEKSDLKILDLTSGKVRDLISKPGSDSNPQFSPDGQSIAFISYPGGFSNRNLQIVRMDGSDLQNMTESFDENILSFEWAPDSKHIFFLANQGMTSKVFRLNVLTSQYKVLEALDGLQVCQGFNFSKNGTSGAAVISDVHTPIEVYLLENAGKSKRRLTQINKKFVGKAPKTETLEYKSKDGLNLEALVIKPKNFQAGKRYPLLVIVHGGPAGVFNYSFNPRRGAYPLFAFADQGYVLFLPNPRGSTGYGQSFRGANYKDLGGKDFQDIMTGIDLLIDKGVVDPDRMGLMGWSYGGFMAYWTITHSDLFKAISAGAGLTNLLSFYGTNDAEGVGIELYFGGPPWDNAKLLLEHSAIYFIKNAKTPLLIQHVEKDVRVPLSQAQEFYFAAKKTGLPVKMVVYPGQGHSIQQPRLVLHAMMMNLNWFNKWLLGIKPTKKSE